MTILGMPVHVIGVGVGGSRIVRELAEKGPEYAEVHAWDGDEVTQENVRAQTYLPSHVGLRKVDALRTQAKLWGNVDLNVHCQFVTEPTDLRGIVFLCVDKMSVRKQIWEESIRGRSGVSLMIEMRLETTGALVHVVNPSDPVHVRKWERYWYPDDDATTAGLSCGAATSLGPIGSLTASLCVWQLVRFARIQSGEQDSLDNQIRVSMVPLHVESYQW